MALRADTEDLKIPINPIGIYVTYSNHKATRILRWLMSLSLGRSEAASGLSALLPPE